MDFQFSLHESFISGETIEKIFSWRKMLHTQRNHSRNWMRDVMKHEKVTITAFADAGEEEKRKIDEAYLEMTGEGGNAFHDEENYSRFIEQGYAGRKEESSSNWITRNQRTKCFLSFAVRSDEGSDADTRKKIESQNFYVNSMLINLGRVGGWGWRCEGTNCIEFHILIMTASGCSQGDFILVSLRWDNISHFSHNTKILIKLSLEASDVWTFFTFNKS